MTAATNYNNSSSSPNDNSNDGSKTTGKVYADLWMEDEEEPIEDTAIELRYHSNHNDCGGNVNCSGHQKIIMLDVAIRGSCSKFRRGISGKK